MAEEYVLEAYGSKIIGGGGGSSSGGHTIWNKIKTILTQRSNLWFKDAKISDDTTNQATTVEVIQTITKDSFDLLPTDGTADGFYEIDDDESSYLDKTISLENDQENTSAEKAIGRENLDAVGSLVVKTVELVTALPADAGDHPEILYLIKES